MRAPFAGTLPDTVTVRVTAAGELPPPLLVPPLPLDVPPPVVTVDAPPVCGGSGMTRHCGVDEPFSKVRNESASALVGGKGHLARGLDVCAASFWDAGGGVGELSTGTYPAGRPLVKTSLSLGN